MIASDNDGEEVYTVAGRTMSSGSGGEDVYLLRVDASGNLVWEWVAGDDQLDEVGRCVIETDDGDLVIAGNSGSYIDEFFDIFLMKVEIKADINVSIRPTDRTALYRGEILEFRSVINNNTDHVVEGDYWLSTEYPNGNIVLIPDALLSFPGVMPGRIFPFKSLELDNALCIPSNAPTGIYRLVGRLGLCVLTR